MQFKVCQVAHISLAYLDKHSTLDPVMVSVVTSIPTGGNFLLKFFKSLDVDSGLKCKCDPNVKTRYGRVILTVSDTGSKSKNAPSTLHGDQFDP